MALSDKIDFQEVAHSGGTVTIRIGTDASGRRGHQLMWNHCRPVRAVLFAVHALPQGIVVSQMNLGGIGQPEDPPPIPGCYRVFIGSDSEGLFGHQCPDCQSYWRGDLAVRVCPYCGIRAGVVDFLTPAQRSYIKQYCMKLKETLSADIDGDYVIDMDAVADAAGKNTPKPAFYYAEESQQNKFICNACGGVNDILGTFGYCSLCGTRNDLQELSDKMIPLLRDRINSGGPHEACVRDSVAAFDSITGQYVTQLARHVPMTPDRKARLENRRFHNLQSVATDLKEIFDIDLLNGLEPEEIEFAELMFHRRHVYEHKGGEADERYIAESGDKSVRPKQALRETSQSAHRIAGLVLKMATNLHRGFHEILPAESWPTERHERNKPPGLDKRPEVTPAKINLG